MRFYEPQFYFLAAKAKECPTKAGYLLKKSGKKATPESPGIRWQRRWCILYFNLIFYYETEQSGKPQGVILLEGSECHKMCSYDRKLFSFVAGMPGEDYRKFMFSAETEEDCDEWMAAVNESSCQKIASSFKDLTAKIETLESQVEKEKEKREKVQREVSDQWAEIVRLKMELSHVKAQNSKRNSIESSGSVRSSGSSFSSSHTSSVSTNVDRELTPKENQLIVKLQACIRGWICRSRWMKVRPKFFPLNEDNEKLRQRNKLIWQFMTSERDYVKQLQVIVYVFQRSFALAAKTDDPVIDEAEVESLFSNSEVILLMHQLFLNGMEERLAFWPMVQLDTFLSAVSSMTFNYHEYIRNHTYALQTLAQCKKRPKFNIMLKWHEQKEVVSGQTIVQLLYAPVRMIPNYIRYFHDLIEATPEDVSDKDLLEEVLEKLEDMQTGLNDILSEGESIRHTLEIERLIDGGCNVLLDVNQKFIRHGVLRQINSEFKVSGMKREKIRHCFLFSKHMIVTSRTTDGSLRLAKVCGMVPLKYTTLIEDIENESLSSHIRGLSFLLKVQTKGETFHVALMATKSSDKAGWTSDITECIYTISVEEPDELDTKENKLHRKEGDLKSGEGMVHNKSVSEGTNEFKTKSLRDDSRLIQDAKDIKYGEKVGPFSLPQIQYASVDRLIERLLDPRFPGTEYMETFLLTYRMFTSAKTVIEALIMYYYNMEKERQEVIEEQRKQEEEKKKMDERDRFISVLSTSSRASSLEDISFSRSGERKSFTQTPSLDTDSAAQGKFLKNAKESPHFFHDDTLITTSKGRTASLQYPTSAINQSVQRRRTSPAVLLGHGKTQSVDYLPSIGYVQDEYGSTSGTLVDEEIHDEASIVENEIDIPDLSGMYRIERSSSDRAPRIPGKQISVERSISDVGTRYSRGRPATVFVSSNDEDADSQQGSSMGSESVFEDMGSGADLAVSYDESSHGHSEKRRNTSVESAGFDDSDYMLRWGQKAKMSLELPRNPLLSEIQFDSTKRMSLPDTGAPTGYQKNLVKWLGIESPVASQDKGKKKKGKNYEDRLFGTDYPSDEEIRSRDGSVSISDRLLGKSPRKSFLQSGKSPPGRNSKKAQKGNDSPETPRKKRGIFGNAFKSGISGMKRSKSDFLRTPSSSSPIREVEEILPNGRLNLVGDGESTPGTGSECDSESTKDVEPEFKEQTDSTDQNATASCTDDSKNRSRRTSSVLSVRSMACRAPLKVMNVLKHWLSIYPQDFDTNIELSHRLHEFLNDIKEKEETLTLVRNVLKTIERLLDANRQTKSFLNPIDDVLTRHLSGIPPRDVTKDPSWTPITVAENFTLLEHHLYSKIPSQEFLKCAWTKKDKETKAPYILKVSKRFNQVTNLISWRVVHGTTPEERAEAMSFWINVAIECKKLNNFNTVLQISGGLSNSAVYRMKKSWELVPKQLKKAFEELQALVSADKSFRRLREALHKCNPPCVPYLGLYLSDLLFMDEGAKNFNEDDLVNFAKMNRISRCIREIKEYQQLRYTLEVDADTLYYLVNTEVDYDEDKLYDVSLELEPRESVQRTE